MIAHLKHLFKHLLMILFDKLCDWFIKHFKLPPDVDDLYENDPCLDDCPKEE